LIVSPDTSYVEKQNHTLWMRNPAGRFPDYRRQNGDCGQGTCVMQSKSPNPATKRRWAFARWALYGLGFWVASGIISSFCAGDTILGKVFNTLFWGFGAIMVTPSNWASAMPPVLLANAVLYVLIFGSAGIVVRSLRTPR
jgi:hypothetical protein